MADLYVATTGMDSNDGTKNSPYKSIEKASAEAESGTTVHVAPGTYYGGISTDADGVKYVSDVKWGAKIVPGATDTESEAWDNRGANVTIDGFEVDGSTSRGGSPWLYGIYTGGSNSVIQNTKVHDIARSSEAMSAAGSGGQGGAGIMGDSYYGGSNIEVLNNLVYNVGPDDDSSTLVHGIYMATSGEVRNNTVHDIVGDGISSWHDATDLTITGNKVSDSNGAGILVGAGDQYQTSAPNDHTLVANNSVHDNAKGIEENGDIGENNSYTGNSVSGNGTNWSLQDGSASGAAAADALFLEASGDDGLILEAARDWRPQDGGAPLLPSNEAALLPTHDGLESVAGLQDDPEAWFGRNAWSDGAALFAPN